MRDISAEIASIALELKAIKLQPSNPFTWTTGYRMPIYNDNRVLLGPAAARNVVAEAFAAAIRESKIEYDVIAGVETAAIAWAACVADKLEAPLCYVRKKAKEHGAKKRVEGADVTGKRAIVIEDLISTGSSSVEAIIGIREAGGTADHCISIFTYCFTNAAKAFADANTKVSSLLTYEQLIPIAAAKGYITREEQALLAEWSCDPFVWGEKNGFPKVEK